MINRLFQDLSALPQVEAIALGGSRLVRILMRNLTMISICTALHRFRSRFAGKFWKILLLCGIWQSLLGTRG